jgi:2-iminoacetate synthase
MATCTQLELGSFVDWIRQTDDHAAHHLALLARTERALGALPGTPAAERDRLAQKLERWRYQHLNEHARSLLPEDEALVDALDWAARQLTGRDGQAPRHTRHAVHDPAWETASIRRACTVLDPAYPLPELIERAARLTCDNFAADPLPPSASPQRRRMLLYAPLYVSSRCVNYCLYCGFRYPLEIARKHLSVAEAIEQARILRERGFAHLLIVGGDFPSFTTTAYYRQIAEALVAEGIEPGIEIAPQTTDAYAELVSSGVCGLTLYQETYQEELYARYHVRGPKSSYHWRLESHDRAAEAGMPRLGLGILLGLAHPRQDLLAMMRHAAYLAHRFPDRQFAFSLPRIHEAPEDFQVPHPVSDDDLVRLYCALRIAFPRATLVLSTREPASLRCRLARICITQMSAGSSTAPGGYRETGESGGQQFPVADRRSPAEVAEWLQREGFQVCWSFESASSRCR